MAKPDGLLVVPPAVSSTFLHPLPVERLWGVGSGNRREAPRSRDRDRRSGRRGWRRTSSCACSGARPDATSSRSRTTVTRGASASAAAAARSARSARWPALAAGARPRARRPGRPRHPPDAQGRPVGRTVVLRLRFDDFTRATRSHTLPRCDGAHARRCWRPPWAARRGAADDRGAAACTLLGLAVANLDDDSAVS